MTDSSTSATAAGDAVPAAKSSPEERSFWRRPRPIAVYLVMLALVALLPALLYSALVLQRNNEAQHEVVQTLVYGTAGSIAQSVDRELASMLTTVRVLATLPSLHDGNYRAFHSRAQAALNGSGSFMILLDERFDQILNTRVAYGTKLGKTSDPESARTALESGEPVVSDVFLGQTSGKWVFNIVLPVFDPNRPDRTLILTRDAENLSVTLQSQQFPPGWKVALLDASGRAITSTETKVVVGEPFFLETRLENERGLVQARADGETYLAVVQPSLHSDWRVVAWAPRDVVRAQFSQSFWLLVGGGAMIGLAALLAVFWLSRQIGHGVRRLAREASRLGAGDKVRRFDSPITEVATVSAALSEAAAARKGAENEIRFLMREVAHRSKNQLAVISAIAKQTAKGSDSLQTFEDAFQKRLQGLARSTDLMVRENVPGVELRALVEAQIEPFRPPQDERVSIEGPHRRLSIHSAQMLGMAVHELATNAAKYGAFAETGVLEVTWRESVGRLDLRWRERDVPEVRGSDHSGFGTMVVERMVGQSLGAEVGRVLHGDGIEWRFEIPLENLEFRPGEEDEGRNEPQ